MTAEPSDEEILAAIRESGYLMEQEVASELESHGLHVRTNVAFTDPDEDKSREMDVVAFRRIAVDEESKIAAFIELIVECKNSRNPFVFISRPKNAIDRRTSPEEFVFPLNYTMTKIVNNSSSMIKNVDAFSHLGFNDVYEASINEWKAVQFCRIDRNGKGGWHANHGGLYDAMFYPMAKALQARKREKPKSQGGQGSWKYIWLFFPIVVTSGDILILDSTRPDIGLQRIPHVTFYRELKAQTITGNFGVTFVKQSHLKEILNMVVDPMAAHASGLIDDRREFLWRTALDWVD